MVTGGKTSIILFHWSKCGHCISMMPEWKKFAESMKDQETISVVDIENSDMDKADKLIAAGINEGKYEVDGYPTIIKAHDGNVEIYNGDRTVKGFTEWAKPTEPKKQGGGKKRGKKSTRHRKTNKKRKTRKH